MNNNCFLYRKPKVNWRKLNFQDNFSSFFFVWGKIEDGDFVKRRNSQFCYWKMWKIVCLCMVSRSVCCVWVLYFSGKINKIFDRKTEVILWEFAGVNSFMTSTILTQNQFQFIGQNFWFNLPEASLLGSVQAHPLWRLWYKFTSTFPHSKPLLLSSGSDTSSPLNSPTLRPLAGDPKETGKPINFNFSPLELM